MTTIVRDSDDDVSRDSADPIEIRGVARNRGGAEQISRGVSGNSKERPDINDEVGCRRWVESYVPPALQADMLAAFARVRARRAEEKR